MSARGGSAWARKNNRDGGMSAAAFGATFSSSGRISPVVLAPRGCLPWEGDAERGQVDPPVNARDEIRPGSYSHQLAAPTKRFQVLWNGSPIGVHASEVAALAAASKLSRACGSDIRCFAVQVCQ